MKYIYFERHQIDNDVPIIKNCNILINKPEGTDGDYHGIQSFRNINQWSGKTHIIDQYWVDLQRYDFEYQKGHPFDNYLMEAFDQLNLRQNNY
jgi:hypothetical protein